MCPHPVATLKLWLPVLISVSKSTEYGDIVSAHMGGGSNKFVATNSSRLRKCFFIGMKVYNGCYSVDIQFECLECVAFVNYITEWIKCENMLVMCKGMQKMHYFQQNAIENITGMSLCFWRNFHC